VYIETVLFSSNIVPLQGLHGNPDDYAWGAGGLDAIITQVSTCIYLYRFTSFTSC